MFPFCSIVVGELIRMFPRLPRPAPLPQRDPASSRHPHLPLPLPAAPPAALAAESAPCCLRREEDASRRTAERFGCLRCFRPPDPAGQPPPVPLRHSFSSPRLYSSRSEAGSSPAHARTSPTLCSSPPAEERGSRLLSCRLRCGEPARVTDAYPRFDSVLLPSADPCWTSSSSCALPINKPSERARESLLAGRGRADQEPCTATCLLQRCERPSTHSHPPLPRSCSLLIPLPSILLPFLLSSSPLLLLSLPS
eukprot:263195-Hanusia_phi.AAC.2